MFKHLSNEELVREYQLAFLRRILCELGILRPTGRETAWTHKVLCEINRRLALVLPTDK